MDHSGAGTTTTRMASEKREPNRILYSLVGERLALPVGDFLSASCLE